MQGALVLQLVVMGVLVHVVEFEEPSEVALGESPSACKEVSAVKKWSREAFLRLRG